MTRFVKALLLSTLLATPALAQMPAAVAPVPYPPKAADYPDSEIRPTLEWQELVEKANQYRLRQATEEAARQSTSQAQPQPRSQTR